MGGFFCDIKSQSPFGYDVLSDGRSGLFNPLDWNEASQSPFGIDVLSSIITLDNTATFKVESQSPFGFAVLSDIRNRASWAR